MQNSNAWMNTVHVTTNWRCVCGEMLSAHELKDRVTCSCGRSWKIDFGQLNMSYKDAPRDPAKEPGSLWQPATA